MANDETTGLLTAAERDALERWRVVLGYGNLTPEHRAEVDQLEARTRMSLNAYSVKGLLWADDRARALITAAEARGVARGVEQERARTELLADHLIGWCAAVDEDASWDSWDSWFKDAAFPRGTTPFDVLMCEHYRRVADADSPHAAYAEQQLERMSRAAGGR